MKRRKEIAILIILSFIFKCTMAQDESKMDSQEPLNTAEGAEIGDESIKGFGLGKKFGFLGEMADSVVDMLRIFVKSYNDLDLEELKSVKFPTDRLFEPGGENCSFTLPFRASDLVGTPGARLQHFADMFRVGKYAEVHIYENLSDDPKQKPLNVDFLIPRDNNTRLERRLRVSFPDSDGYIALYGYFNGTTEVLLERIWPPLNFFAKERRFSMHLMEKHENWYDSDSRNEYLIEVTNKCRLFTFVPTSWLPDLQSKVFLRYPLLMEDDLMAGDDLLDGFWAVAGFASQEEAPPVLLQACFKRSFLDIELMSCASPFY